jgi:hypothetical protein
VKRRLNYTNRRNLTPEHISINLEEQKGGQPPRFTARIEIPAAWALKPDAKIYVEPYVASTSMRFPFGTVNEIAHPADTTLRDVDAGNVLFRVKVVDESGDMGMLLASAEEVRPHGQEGEESEGTRSFFPLVMKDLGQAIWKVEITRSDRPRLLLNNQIPGLREQLLTDPLLQGAILPSAMQLVLHAMLASEFSDSEWVPDWKMFVENLCGNSVLPADDGEVDEDDIPAIISSAIAAFVDAKRFGENAKAKTVGGSGE